MSDPDLDVASTGGALSLLAELIRRGPMARTDLAALRGESLPQMTKLGKQLIDAGLVIETTGLADGRGRPRRPLAVRADALHFAGVDVSADEVTGVVIDLLGRVVASTRLDLAKQDPEAIADAVATTVDALSPTDSRPDGLGICLDGNVQDQSVVSAAAPFGWDSAVRLADLATEATGLATVVENTIGAATEMERWFGARSGSDNFVVLSIGEQIAMGAVVHGQRLPTAGSGFGLIEHHPLAPDGPRCAAGHTGCADMLTTTSLCRAAGRVLRRKVDYAQVLAMAEHPRVGPLVQQAAGMLGRLIAAAANFLQPDHVVLIGQGAELVKVAAVAVDAGIAADRNPAGPTVEYEVHPVNRLQWARGAATVALDSRLRRS